MARIQELVAIQMNPRTAKFVGSTGSDGLSATGTTQGAGYPIAETINRFTTVAAGVNDSSTLPLQATYPQDYCVIRNDGAGTLQVFPGSGEFINASAVNTAVTIAAGSGKIFFKCTASNNKWITL